MSAAAAAGAIVLLNNSYRYGNGPRWTYDEKGEVRFLTQTEVRHLETVEEQEAEANQAKAMRRVLYCQAAMVGIILLQILIQAISKFFH